MGSVLLGREPKSGQAVAIKVLHERDPELLARFAREAEVMSKIQDPRVVRALDAGLHEGQPYLVLEFCPGQDLAAYLKTRGTLEPDQAVELLAGIGRGLMAAHEVGALHRDLKPANVLIDSKGQPKVTDFGLAHQAQGKLRTHSLTQSGVILGTPAYMAPEQMHDARRADARSDVYALGVILYECLAGERPFGTGPTLAIMQRVIEGERKPLPATLPAGLREVVDCAMALDPADRFNDARSFVAALEEFSADLRSATGSNTKGLLVGVLLFGVLVGVGLLLGTLLLRVTATPSNTPAALPPEPPRTDESPAPEPPRPDESPSSVATPSRSPRAPAPVRDDLRFCRASLAEVRLAADAGNLAATTELGIRLSAGRGVPPNRDRGVELLSEAARLGDRRAMVEFARALGSAKAARKGLPQEARAWLEQARQAGSAQAGILLARMDKDPTGYQEALAGGRRDLAAGDPEAYLALVGVAYQSGDLDLAREVIREGTRHGIPHAFAMRGRFNRARWKPCRADFERAVTFHEPEGLCGLARLLLEQVSPSEEERDKAEELLAEAERMDFAGAKVERLLELWRVGKVKAWSKRASALLRQPRESLHPWQWGDMGLHLAGVLPEVPRRLQGKIQTLALRALKRAGPAKSLDPRVTSEFGVALYLGMNTKDKKKAHASAMPYFERAAGEGNPPACHAFGLALATGDGAQRNVAKGLLFLEEAGQQGHYPAWEKLGHFYATGSLPGVGKDLARALDYFLKAARDPDKERPWVCGRIALLYTTLDQPGESRVWAERAAKGKDPIGSAHLGELLVLGHGGERDPDRGAELLKQLADRSSLGEYALPTAVRACALLAEHYRLGKLLPLDPDAAERYELQGEMWSKKLAESKAERR
jgi:serine/threonine protein kinase